MTGLRGLSAPQQLLIVCTVLGTLGGGILGLVRGLDYLPTLPVAIIEGGVLIGIASAIVGVLLAGVWWLGQATCQRISR